LIVNNGAALQKLPVQRELLLQQNIMMVFVCGQCYSTHTVAQSKWKDGKGDVLPGTERCMQRIQL
jgi:hypothetical protein